MAIKTNINFKGISIDNSYIRVEFPSCTKDTITFSVRKYVVEDKPFFEESVYTTTYNLEGENPFKQAYLYLKTLPEFQDAVDC